MEGSREVVAAKAEPHIAPTQPVFRKFEESLDLAAMLVRMYQRGLSPRLHSLRPGETLEVCGYGLVFVDDIVKWCQLVGDELVDTRTEGNLVTCVLRKRR
jgi:TusA-related sulfurtransferase